MENNNARDGLIPTKELSRVNVPRDDAKFEELETFCLTVDGYQDGRSLDDLVREADRVERNGVETATLEELRAAAFIRQREHRWSTDQGQTDEPLVRQIRALVSEIRRRVSG